MEAVLEVWPLHVGDQIILARVIAFIVVVLVIYETSSLYSAGVAIKDIFLHFLGLKNRNYFKNDRIRNGFVLLITVLVLVILFDMVVNGVQLQEILRFTIAL